MSSSQLRAAWQLPVQWPRAGLGVGIGHSGKTELLFKGAIVLAMLALTVFDRFGLRVTDRTSISASLMAMYALAGAMVLVGAAQLSARAALAYVAVTAMAALSLMVNSAYVPAPFVSKMSFLLLVVLYAPLCVSLRRGSMSPDLWRWVVTLYISFAVFIAVAGITQYFAQFVIQPPWLFDFTPLIPDALQASRGWNTVNFVYNPAGGWVKSNGFFMREASMFSILMAFGILCELSLAKRKWVLAVLGSGLVLSYSGSGLACLAAGLLFPLGRGTVARVVAFALLAGAIVLLLGDALNLAYTVNRVDEFGKQNSSAYCRFIYPTVATLQQIDSSPWSGLLGHGPGSMERMGATCADGHQTTYAKAVFEYGILGSLAFAVLILDALNRSRAPLRIRVGAGVAWVLLGGNLLDSLFLLFIYVVSAMWPQGAAAEAVSKAPDVGRVRAGS